VNFQQSWNLFFFLMASAVVAACLIVLAISCWRFLQHKRLSPARSLVTVLALVPVAIFIAAMGLDAGTNYNPGDASLRTMAGTYSHGDVSLELRWDGTYASHNLEGAGSGTWSHDDWNLTLHGSSLQSPRWIHWRGSPAILPYYRGADAEDGLILRKQAG